MTRNIVTFLKRVACVGLLATCLFSTEAQAQVFIPPPAEWLATTTPVYFEGRAAYWYGGRWFYRDGNAWGYYRDEPGFLRDYRVRRPEPERRYYEGRGEFHGGGYRRR